MSIGWSELGTWLAAALGGVAAAPTDHVRQHKLWTIPADLGFLTPHGEITVLSDIIVMTLVASALLILFVPFGIKKRKGADEVGQRVPKGPATVLETICWGLRELMARPLLGRYTDRFIPFIWTVFFFILTLNLLGLLPLGSFSTLFGTHVGGTATANVWTTGTLAFVTLVMLVVNGLRLGRTHYVAHFNPVPRDMHWIGRILLSIIMIPIEIAGTFFKIMALAIRLFANMVAGHILLAVLAGLIISAGTASLLAGAGLAAIIVPASAAITLLEIFVAVLQAFIFTFLTTLFLGQAVLFEHDGHGEHGAAH